MNRNDGCAGRVIVTYSRSWQALVAIRSLGERGIEVIAGDEFGLTPGGLSRYAHSTFRHSSPTTHPDAFLAELEAVVRKHAPPPGVPYVLMPIHREGHVIAKARARFESTISLPLAPSETIERARHKSRLIELARELGLSVPQTAVPESEAELERAALEMTYPAFVKLPDGVSGIGVRRVDTPEQLICEYRDLVTKYGATGDNAPLIQAAVDGEDYCVAALFDRGRHVASMVYQSVVTFPRHKGPGVVRETVSAPELEQAALELLGALEWHGVAEVDFRWSGKLGDPGYVIEVNPRFFGGLFQAIASGVDFPWLLFQLAATGHAEPPGEVAIGVRTQAPVTGMLGIFSEIVRRPGALETRQRAWRAARTEIEAHHGWRAAGALLSGLKQSVDAGARVEHVREVLERNRRNLTMLLDAQDPLPALGLLYPLSAFLRHGRISSRLLGGVRG